MCNVTSRTIHYIVYVYDSNDGSCELVLRKSLSGVDLAYKIMPSIPLYKMCMLVGLPAFKCYVYTYKTINGPTK